MSPSSVLLGEPIAGIAHAIELEASNAQMRIDNAKLKAPMRIKELAASSMGMSVPEQVYFAQEQVD